MLAKKILISGLFLLCTGSFAYAAGADLIVDNQTNEDSTTSIPSPISPFKCSSGIPGGYGITHKKSVNHISHNLLVGACVPNLSNCVTQLYMNDNCQGVPIATVTFDTTGGGLKGKPVYSDEHPRYTITGSGYNITITYNPAVAANK